MLLSTPLLPPKNKQKADAFEAKVESGEAMRPSSGYITKGYKFDGTETTEKAKLEVMQKIHFEVSQVGTE